MQFLSARMLNFSGFKLQANCWWNWSQNMTFVEEVLTSYFWFSNLMYLAKFYLKSVTIFFMCRRLCFISGSLFIVLYTLLFKAFLSANFSSISDFKNLSKKLKLINLILPNPNQSCFFVFKFVSVVTLKLTGLSPYTVFLQQSFMKTYKEVHLM